MTITTTTFTIVPIPLAEAAELRRQGGEVYVADAVPGFPCRQCLRDAEIGEEMILVSHDPFETESPYRSASPIFLHRADCGEPAVPTDGAGGLPHQLTCRRLAVRAFDTDEMMLAATIIDGDDLADTIETLFATDDADRLEVYNADRGCWAATVARAEG